MDSDAPAGRLPRGGANLAHLITREAEQDRADTEARERRGETHDDRVQRLRKLVPDAGDVLIESAATACNPEADPAAVLHICRLVANEPGWREAAPANKDAIVVEICRAHKWRVADSTIRAILGRLDHRLQWVSPPAAPEADDKDDDFGIAPALETPDEDEAPEALPGVAWDGCATMIVAKPKQGKTMLVAALAAAATGDGKTVLWIGTDDPGVKVQVRQFGGAMGKERTTTGTRIPVGAWAQRTGTRTPAFAPSGGPTR